MLVVPTFGTKAGQVVDLPPLSARAMLADGRARTVREAPDDVPVVSEQVALRRDRAMPTTKARRHR